MELQVVLLLILSVSLASVCAVFAYFLYKWSYWPRKNVVSFTPKFPYGNFEPAMKLKQATGDFTLEYYTKFRKLGQRVGGLYMLAEPTLMVVDPALVKDVLATDFQIFNAKSLFEPAKHDPLSAHLLNVHGSYWKKLRTKLTPTFTSGKIKMMFETMVKCVEELDVVLNNFVQNSEAFDTKELMGRFTTDIIGRCAFGIECNSLKDPDVEFRRYGLQIFHVNKTLAAKRLVMKFFPKLYHWLKFTRLPKHMCDFFLNMVKETVEYRQRTGIERKDFMQLLIQMMKDDEKEPEENRIGMGEISAQALIFFLAGFETSSTAMSYIMYDLATHQEIQRKVREEIKDMLIKYNEKLTYEGLAELHYLDQVINESMRLHPPVQEMNRRCMKKYKFANTDVEIDEGVTVIIPILGLHTDAEYYPDPLKYDPERFSNSSKSSRHPYTFLPFSEGPRICIGSRFGFLQVKLGLVALLRDHKYIVDSKTVEPLVKDPKCLVQSAKDGIWLRAATI